MEASLTTRIVRKLAQNTLIWNWGLNFRRTLRQSFQRQPSRDSSLIAELKENGVFVKPATHFFSAKELRHLDHIRADMEERLKKSEVQELLKAGDSGRGGKSFATHLLTEREFDISSPYVQLAIQPRILGIVNQYMGMKSYLREILVWLNFPTTSPAAETQLWHRDGDDHMNIKVFIYLNDVNDANGPFCFIPQTHPQGRLQLTRKWERVGDSEMASMVNRDDWRIFTGEKYSVIVADTNGFHKGQKLLKNHRIMLSFHYTSGRPWYPSKLVIHNDKKHTLSTDQAYALYN